MLKKLIKEYLTQHESGTTIEISKWCGKHESHVRRWLYRMYQEGQLIRVQGRTYGNVKVYRYSFNTAYVPKENITICPIVRTDTISLPEIPENKVIHRTLGENATLCIKLSKGSKVVIEGYV